MTYLLLDLEAHNRRTAVLFLTSKTSVSRRGDFLAVIFLTVTEVLDYIGMLSLKISGLNANEDSIIDLYCS